MNLSNANVTFGRYLRRLRERRGLSLDRIEHLTRAFADPIHKAYLSRCENGRQRTSFSKLVALCRVLEVPSEVLLERMDLDLEAERRGVADPQHDPGATSDALAVALDDAAAAAVEGEAWAAYGCYRSAHDLAACGPVLDRFGDVAEQRAYTSIMLASSAGKLGRNRYALFELEWVEEHYDPKGRTRALLDERLSVRLLRLGRPDDAYARGERALATCREAGFVDLIGPVCFDLALSAMEGGRWDDAVGRLRQSLEYMEHAPAAGRDGEAVKCHLALATALLGAGDHAEARLVIQQSLERLQRTRSERGLAKALTLLGDVHESEGRSPEATAQWRRARRVARGAGEYDVVLEAEIRLLRAARRQNRDAAARSIERRIRGLWPELVSRPERAVRPGRPASLASA